MNTDRIDNLRKQCGGPRDGALLRFSLGTALLAEDDHTGAIEHLQRATEFDPAYSAAWKLLGNAFLASGDKIGAGDAWRQEMAAAEQRGDKQAQKEMAVFLRRLEKSSA